MSTEVEQTGQTSPDEEEKETIDQEFSSDPVDDLDSSEEPPPPEDLSLDDYFQENYASSPGEGIDAPPYESQYELGEYYGEDGMPPEITKEYLDNIGDHLPYSAEASAFYDEYMECLGRGSECLGEYELPGQELEDQYDIEEPPIIETIIMPDKSPENQTKMNDGPERPKTPPPPRVPTEEQFVLDLVHPIPETPARETMSKEALEWEDRRLTPSPPGSPKNTFPRMHECPSVESFLKLGEPIHVQFFVLPTQVLFAAKVRLDRTIAELKHDISPIIKVLPEYIDLRKSRNLVMDYKTLKDLGARPGKKIRFTVELSKRCNPDSSLKIPTENKIDQLPAVRRNVIVEMDNHVRQIHVRIEFASEAKLFIGGYRDKRFNVYYHHAITQTPFYAVPYSQNVSHFSGQTFDNTWKSVQTLKDNYQQTASCHRDYYESSIEDKVIWAKPYLSSEYIEVKRLRAVIIIQKYWRRWLAIRERASRLLGLIKRVEWAENIRKERTEARLAIIEDEMWRQHHPSRMVDIELLYRAINEWRRTQVEYIELHRWGADRKAALAVIMEKEADLLLDLERTKTKITQNTYDLLVEGIFQKMGKPTRWLNRSGNFVQMDNRDKHDLRQHHKLYNQLKAPVTDKAERFEILDKLVDCVKPYNMDLSNYLISLIAREKDLMDKKANKNLLVGLRKRIMNIFYHLMRDPRINPEAKKLQAIPFDSKKLRKDMIQCKGCRKMQYRDQFTVVRGVTVTSRCITCTALYRTCILRSDLNLYRRILADLRHEEQLAGVNSSVTYLIDAYDMQFLIEQLWHAQSALSGIDDRYLLRICRWKKDLPWTPWNCVLLTDEEAIAHLHLEDMNAAYQKSFFHKVHVKHQAARIYFARLTSLSIPLDPALQAYCADLEKQKLKKKIKPIPGVCNF